MVWKKRKKYYGLYEKYSIINKYKKEDKLNDNILNYINNISLEDLIAIKLELATRILKGKYYGLPLWSSIRHIAADAVLKTAASVCRTKSEAARFLGLDYTDFRKLVKKYKTESFFKDERYGGETVSTEDE
jgi:hypothetical protein